MNTVEELKKQIHQAKKAVIDIRNKLEADVYGKDIEFKFPPFPSYNISEGVSEVFKRVRDEVLHEKNLYTPISKTTNAENTGEAGVALTTETPVIRTVEHNYVTDFEKQIKTSSIFECKVDKFPEHLDLKNLKPSDLNLFKVLHAELDFVTENMVALGVNIALLNKMKQAVESIGLERLTDALTILRTAKKSAPNNRSLSYMLSQVYYYKAANGSSENLPEARGEAKKASLYAEDVNQSQLMQYRYSYVMHESNHDAAKALNLIREYYLLNPESLTEGHGLGVHEGVHLKTWILVSMMDAKFLTKYEVESILSITMTAATGVNFYLNVMRPQVLTRLVDSDDSVIAPLYLVEDMLAKSYQNYSEITGTIQKNFDNKGKLLPESSHLWTLENRYVNLLVNASSLPLFDEIYLYTSLDAKRHSSEAYPNKAMPAMGLTGVNYWQIWSLAITAVDGRRGVRTLPVSKIVPYAEVFRKFDEILESLKLYEKEIVPNEKWEIIQKYMPNYEYNIFIHIAAGPEAFQVPSNPYYLNFYRQWVLQKPKAPLPSEIIEIYAESGHFIEPEEVIAAFEGILRVVTDDVHGLKARAKVALKFCLTKEKGKGASKVKDLLRESHFNDYWWLYVVVIPLAILVFFIIFGSGSVGSGMMLLVIIGLAVGGFGYVIYKFASKPNEIESDEDLDENQVSEETEKPASKED